MNVFRYAPKNRMAALKKKSEPTVASTNNPSFQNKLRKITNDLSNNASPNLCPLKTTSLSFNGWSLESKPLSPVKNESFSAINKKKDDIFASTMTFSQFYPGTYIYMIISIICKFLCFYRTFQ